MCGIIGIAGESECASRLVDALRRLEYRGYDSAGLATFSNDGVTVRKDEGKIEEIDASLDLAAMPGATGVGHTRWATHGKPSQKNSHPHLSCDGGVAVVHNGIVENHEELREMLQSRGHEFTSDTDTEVIPHLLEERNDMELVDAVREVSGELEGSFAFCAITDSEIVAARDGSPLVLGLSNGENYVASDIPAILPFTRTVKHVMDGEIARITSESMSIQTFEGEPVERDAEVVDWDAEAAEKGGYDHYMLKEIYEQPRALSECTSGRLDELLGKVTLDLGFGADEIRGLEGVEIVGCGTSYHAGLYGARLIEELTGLPVRVQHGSEYRYGPVPKRNVLTVGITQSGETADTLKSMERARGDGKRVLVLTNVVGSTATRIAHDVLYIRSGPEIGVAASKTFTAQLASVAMLAIHIGQETRSLPHSEAKRLIRELRTIPSKMQSILDRAGELEELAKRYADSDALFFIGRGFDYPVALEGALKTKEISYVYSEGYPAGELKHGPLALVTERTPVVTVATDSPVYGKTLSNAKEVEARDGPVIAIASESNDDIEKYCEAAVYVPNADHRLAPLLSSVVTQLFAYHVARELGRPIDKPRNLAKSVTVE